MPELAGETFRQAVKNNKPLPIVGATTAYHALLSQSAGHKAIYLSGGGVAASSIGVPDLAITTANDVIEDAKRITAVCPLPLLVDIDTGFGGAFNIARTIKEMIRSGVAAVHIEDQVGQKRCGHRPNKQLVSTDEMVDRIKAAVDARTDNSFVIMARTDALAVEGEEEAIARAIAYVEAGADMIFPEAMISLENYQRFANAVKVPILANITEFGQTPLFTCKELGESGVSMVLYPLSAFRAASAAALAVYESIALNGHQKMVVDKMQTRADLYDVLGYKAFEDKLDNIFSKKQ